MIDQLSDLGTVDEAAAARVAHAARARVGAPDPPPVPRRRVRRPHLALASMVALGAAIAILLAVHPWGGTRAQAAVLHRALLAITPPAHTIQHIVSVMHQGAYVLRLESWQSIDQPGSDRRLETASDCAGASRDISDSLTELQWFDQAHGRILRAPLDPAKVRASWPAYGPRTQFDPTVGFADALRDGEAHVVGESSVDGMPVTRISWPPDPADPSSVNILTVETATGKPLAWQWGGGNRDATGGIVAQQRFETYEFIPENGATSAALTETASHPDATVLPSMSQRELDANLQRWQSAHCTNAG
jgi:hypothetical protein